MQLSTLHSCVHDLVDGPSTARLHQVARPLKVRAGEDSGGLLGRGQAPAEGEG